MSRVLVVDDLAIFRELIAEVLRRHGYQTLCAANGLEAQVLIDGGWPDVLLLDLSMPEMDGLTLLRWLRGRPGGDGVGVIVLSEATDRDGIVEAGRLGVRDYLLKSRFSTEELLARVGKYAQPDARNEANPAANFEQSPTSEAAPAGDSHTTAERLRTGFTPATVTRDAPMPVSPTPRMLDRDACLTRIRGAIQGKTLRGITERVMSLTGSSRGSMPDLITLIAQDPALTARILQLANSPAYASRKGVIASIPDAVRNIGYGGVRNIAGAMGVFDALPAGDPEGLSPVRCWQHSFATAVLCEQLTQQAPGSIAGPAYLVGLCHDLGEIMLQTSFAEEYRQVQKVQAETGRAREELEPAILGLTHVELVVAVLQSLELPQSIQGPIEAFHRRDTRPSSHSRLAGVLRLAESYANGLLVAVSPQASVQAFTAAECRGTLGEDHPSIADARQVRADALALAALLARLPAGAERRLMEPLLAQGSARLWVARDPILSAFDPITAALESLAQIELHDRLPADGELGVGQGLVVLAGRDSTPGFQGTEVQRVIRSQPDAEVPVLRLVGRVSGNEMPAGVPASESWPVSLASLSQFVQRAETPVPTSA